MGLKRAISGFLSMAFIILCFPLSVNAASNIKGDANGDGKLDIRDAAFIASSLAKGKSLGALADFNGDGLRNIRDAADIAHKLAAPSPTMADEMLRLVNIERQEVGAAPLTLNHTMNDMANIRAKEISVSFSHTRPNGTDCFTIADEFNMPFYGENIAAGNSTVAATMNQWVNSPGHYANITESGYTELGVGYVYVPNSEYRYYWVQIFR